MVWLTMAMLGLTLSQAVPHAPMWPFQFSANLTVFVSSSRAELLLGYYLYDYVNLNFKRELICRGCSEHRIDVFTQVPGDLLEFREYWIFNRPSGDGMQCIASKKFMYSNLFKPPNWIAAERYEFEQRLVITDIEGRSLQAFGWKSPFGFSYYETAEENPLHRIPIKYEMIDRDARQVEVFMSHFKATAPDYDDLTSLSDSWNCPSLR